MSIALTSTMDFVYRYVSKVNSFILSAGVARIQMALHSPLRHAWLLLFSTKLSTRYFSTTCSYFRNVTTWRRRHPPARWLCHKSSRQRQSTGFATWVSYNQTSSGFFNFSSTDVLFLWRSFYDLDNFEQLRSDDIFNTLLTRDKLRDTFLARFYNTSIRFEIQANFLERNYQNISWILIRKSILYVSYLNQNVLERWRTRKYFFYLNINIK